MAYDEHKKLYNLGAMSLHDKQGCGNTMPDLSNLVPFHSGLVEISIYLSLDKYKSKYNSVFHILISYYQLTSCIENSVDPDQLAFSEAS